MIQIYETRIARVWEMSERAHKAKQKEILKWSKASHIKREKKYFPVTSVESIEQATDSKINLKTFSIKIELNTLNNFADRKFTVRNYKLLKRFDVKLENISEF